MQTAADTLMMDQVVLMKVLQRITTATNAAVEDRTIIALKCITES